MCCVIMRSEHSSRTVCREVSCPCSLSPRLSWDYKWRRCLEFAPVTLSLLWYLPYIYWQTGLKKGDRTVFPASPSVKGHVSGPKALGGIGPLEAIFFPRAFLAGCDFMLKTLCQLVLNGSEWLCMCCCCSGVWYKTWTLKPVPWQQQTPGKLCDRPRPHGIKYERQLRQV